MFTQLTWKIWDKFENKQKLMWWTDRIVIGIVILAILAGFLASYRFGEYIQAKVYVQNHTEIIRVQTN